MGRRLLSALLVCSLIVISSITELAAQDASPVPIEPPTIESAVPTEAIDSSLEDDALPIAPAEFDGNTPPGFYSDTQIHVRADAYLNVFQVTVGGQTSIVDGTNGLGTFDAPGYRLDNVKVVTLATTAQYDGSFKLCLIFEDGRFANPATVDLLHLQGGTWTVVTALREGATVCGYSPDLGVFALAEPGASPPTSTATVAPPSSTPTDVATAIPSSTPTALETYTPSPSPTATATVPQTSTTAPSAIHFPLPNVYVTYQQIPESGSTTGEERSAGSVPALPTQYIASNAWYFSVTSTVSQSGNKRLCVTFETAPYANPNALTLLRWSGSSWALLANQVLDSLLDDEGTLCGYTAAFGDFALAERAASTATATRTPSRTPIPTNTASSTATATATPTQSPSATGTPPPSTTPSPTFSPTASATHTATASSTATSSLTATIVPGSYPVGTTLRTTTNVNVRSAAGSSSPSLGVLASGSPVTVTGTTVSAGGLNWVPVSTTLGNGWIAGNYLAPVPSPTPTRTAAPATATRTPGASTPTRTATRPAGGFIAGDAVRTTSNVNLRNAPSTSSTVLAVIPSKTLATITGPGVVSGGTTFYPVTIAGQPAGYLAGSYLQRVTATATPTRTRTPTATVAGVTQRYTTDNVNMRKGPGTNYGKVATIPKGTLVNITGASRRVNGVTWYPIIVNGIGSGWVSGAFLEIRSG